MNRKHYFGIFILVVGVVIGYHFFAAYQAEQQIDKAIQEQTAESGLLSVQYANIDITPFSADVVIDELTIIIGDHIERAHQLTLDLGYLDFLNIYFGGAEYGLKHLNHATITALSPSYINKTERQEIKSDLVTIFYEGDALDGLRSAIKGISFSSNQSVQIQSQNITFYLPQTQLSRVQAQHLTYSATIENGAKNFWKQGNHHIRVDSLVWTPPQSFQDRYSFFIKGFGYPTDKIPFESAELSAAPTPTSNTIQLESSIRSELALLSTEGQLKLHTPIKTSQLKDWSVELTNFSDSFSNVLSNIERLLSISLPKSEDGIQLRIGGTLSDPILLES